MPKHHNNCSIYAGWGCDCPAQRGPEPDPKRHPQYQRDLKLIEHTAKTLCGNSTIFMPFEKILDTFMETQTTRI